ncbi:MAG: acyltransferase 3 [Acidimicrobiales bacterium]|nr:acyltransferase 3 [Acidimicrobiales bacterium]
MPGDDGADTTATEAPVIRPPAPASAGRLTTLDGMRAVFLAVVMAHHMVWAAPGYAEGWVKGAWTGLDGFFVLSGFLIGGLLFSELARTGRIRYGVFVLRRFLRLYPAMLVAIAVMVAVSMGLDHGVWSHLWPTVRAGALYVMNWPFGHNQAVSIEYTHLWSLAVEFQFYLLLPLLLLVLTKLRTPPWAWAAVIGVVMACVWWRRTQVWTGIGSFPLAYVSTDTRVDTLLWGVLVALAIRQGWLGERHRRGLRVLAPTAIAWMVWVAWHVDSRDAFTYDWGMTLSGLAHAIVLSWIVLDGRTVVARVLGSKPLAWLGARSYSMYLYHYPLFFFASRHLTSLTSRERIAAVIVIVIVLSDLSYRLVERPAFKLKDRVGPRPAPVVAPA